MQQFFGNFLFCRAVNCNKREKLARRMGITAGARRPGLNSIVILLLCCCLLSWEKKRLLKRCFTFLCVLWCKLVRMVSLFLFYTEEINTLTTSKTASCLCICIYITMGRDNSLRLYSAYYLTWYPDDLFMRKIIQKDFKFKIQCI